MVPAMENKNPKPKRIESKVFFIDMELWCKCRKFKGLILRNAEELFIVFLLQSGRIKVKMKSYSERIFRKPSVAKVS
jgi:hypothetical protein